MLPYMRASEWEGKAKKLSSYSFRPSALQDSRNRGIVCIDEYDVPTVMGHERRRLMSGIVTSKSTSFRKGSLDVELFNKLNENTPRLGPGLSFSI